MVQFQICFRGSAQTLPKFTGSESESEACWVLIIAPYAYLSKYSVSRQVEFMPSAKSPTVTHSKILLCETACCKIVVCSSTAL